MAPTETATPKQAVAPQPDSMTDLAKWLFEQIDADHAADESDTKHWAKGQIIQLAASACVIERINDRAEERSGHPYRIYADGSPRPRDTEEEPYIGALILRSFALLYADRPGYRAEWHPEWRPDEDLSN